MYAQLPPTYELIEALALLRTADTRQHRAERLLWRAFVAAAVPMLAAAAAMATWRLYLGRSLPGWSLTVFLVLLGLCALSYAGRFAVQAVPLARALRNPMRWLLDTMDRDTMREGALVRRLGRIPPPQLRARQRRVEVELAIWEGMARLITLLLALGPPALVVAGALGKLPTGAGWWPVASVYATAFALGGALAVLVQQYCARPLRRLSHVLAEAAEINEKVGRHAPPA
jgi:hypothetical protein